MFVLLLQIALLSFASVKGDSGEVPVNAETNELPGFENGRLPSPQEVLNMLDSMTGISDEEKESLRQNLLNNINNQNAQGPAAAAPADYTMQTLILFSLLSLVALIFVFFVRKLYKCLMERELKREEKKKNKQLKKKK